MKHFRWTVIIVFAMHHMMLVLRATDRRDSADELLFRPLEAEVDD